VGFISGECWVIVSSGSDLRCRVCLGVTLTDRDEEITWAPTDNKQFSTRSLYNFLTNGGIPHKMAKRIWKCKVSLKIRIFLWQAFQDRIQTV
jgi:hypothetical protein